jgi:hypothetical protein
MHYNRNYSEILNHMDLTAHSPIYLRICMKITNCVKITFITRVYIIKKYIYIYIYIWVSVTVLQNSTQDTVQVIILLVIYGQDEFNRIYIKSG